jgi:hypothetical protein
MQLHIAFEMHRPGQHDSGWHYDAAATGLVAGGNRPGNGFRAISFTVRYGAVASDFEIAFRKDGRFDARPDSGCLVPRVTGRRRQAPHHTERRRASK